MRWFHFHGDTAIAGCLFANYHAKIFLTPNLVRIRMIFKTVLNWVKPEIVCNFNHSKLTWKDAATDWCARQRLTDALVSDWLMRSSASCYHDDSALTHQIDFHAVFAWSPVRDLFVDLEIDMTLTCCCLTWSRYLLISSKPTSKQLCKTFMVIKRRMRQRW